MTKQEIRKQIKNKRNNMDFQATKTYSTKIVKKVINIINQLNIKDFFIYNSFNNEVNTNELIEFLLNNDKNIYLPKIIKDNMYTIPYHKNDILETNHYGIKEPTREPVELNNFICIIPLIAVDQKGNRIGFGKGYYDKYLKDKTCIKIGLCYDFQIIDSIIPNIHDIPVDIIISEKRIINTHNNIQTSKIKTP